MHNKKKSAVAFSKNIFNYFGRFFFSFSKCLLQSLSRRINYLNYARKVASSSQDKGGSWSSLWSQKTDRHTTIRVKNQKGGQGGGVHEMLRLFLTAGYWGLMSLWEGSKKYLMTWDKNVKPNYGSGHPITHVWFCKKSRWGEKMFQLQLWIHFDHWKSERVFGVVFQHVARGT